MRCGMMMNSISFFVVMMTAMARHLRCMPVTAEGVTGYEFLQGIRDIIGSDPNLPRSEVETKPLSGSFSTLHSPEDEGLEDVSYCLTDQSCGHPEAYSIPDVPLSDLQCNKFCFIDRQTRRYAPSLLYSTDNPPPSYLNCGWETCN